MKKRFLGMITLIAGIVLVFAFVECDDGNRYGNRNSIGNGSESGMDLIFSEDFNGTSLDTTKWNICPNLDRQGRSTWMDDMVSVSGG
jgi:hypothetical protein